MTPTRRNISIQVDPVNYDQIRSRHPWIATKGQLAVLSPDSDGFLSALFLCHYLNWRIVGFYDGKALLLRKGLSARDCVFLDIELFRPGIRSIGQHSPRSIFC